MIPRPVELRVARAAIARRWLNAENISCAAAPSESDSDRLGTITLRPHQVDAVHQLRRLLADARGALLADEVGLGKTFVALAIARDALHPIVVTPAGLREMWREASIRAGVPIKQVTAETMSRTALDVSVTAPNDLVIVDEAHHFRNPSTQRYRALARLTVNARVLLVTATPIHNRSADLAALLGLFLGGSAWTLSDDDRGRYIVRRRRAQLQQTVGGANGATPDVRLGIPLVDGPHPVSITDDATTLQALVALPPPIPPSDGGDAGALVTIALARQWASSGGALRGGLRRRLERAAALAAGLEAGGYPSYRDLREWCVGDGAVQLAFPEMLVPASPDAALMLPAVRAHSAAVRGLLDMLDAKPDPDDERAERLREIVRAHQGQRVVAFTAYEDTVRALFRRLRSGVRVCGLTAQGGTVAGGRLSRWEVTAQFAPGYKPPRGEAGEAGRIDLLLTTDLLSEGVNLQSAAVVVHLDLPWTPARLEQRVGRVARMGSAHGHVRVYAMSPPASAESLLGVERCLREKLAAAGRGIGVAGSIVPSFITGLKPREESVATANEATGHAGPPEQLAHARAVVARWVYSGSASGVPTPGSGPVYAAVWAPTHGFLAACIEGSRWELVASAAGRVSDAPADIAAAVTMADGDVAPHDLGGCQAALRALHLWWAGRRAAGDAGLSDVAGAPARLRALARIAAIAQRAPHHVRPQMAALIDRARRAALAPCGIGAESVLGKLGDTPMTDTAWLRAVGAFGEAHIAARFGAAAPPMALTVAGLIVFRPFGAGASRDG